MTLDQWELQPGDQLPAFMERAVRDNDYVLIICTPKYKLRSDERRGGVGYEGDIMTAEVVTNRNERKFIPLFRLGDEWGQAAPSWLRGKYYINFRGTPYPEDRYQDLVTTLHGTRPVAPPLGKPPASNRQTAASTMKTVSSEPSTFGTRGSALYTVPFQLSRRPSPEWVQVFVEKWNHPREWTSMHRPHIASVHGDKVYLKGTTVEEVQKVHRDTLKLALEDTNSLIAEYERKKYVEAERERLRREEHERAVREAAKNITFE